MNEIEKKFSSAEKLSATDLDSSIRKLCEGLVYISETDSPLHLITGGKASSISAEDVVNRFGDDRPKWPVEEIGFGEFFGRLTKMQDWYGDEERERVRKYRRLRTMLESNLSDLHVFRVGRVQIDIYVIGLDREKNLIGIKTKAVET
jgi:hypothetical protein